MSHTLPAMPQAWVRLNPKFQTLDPCAMPAMQRALNPKP